MTSLNQAASCNDATVPVFVSLLKAKRTFRLNCPLTIGILVNPLCQWCRDPNPGPFDFLVVYKMSRIDFFAHSVPF